MALDETTNRILEHLEMCKEDKIAVDAGFVGAYTRTLYKDKVFPEGKIVVESNEFLGKFVPLINSLLYDKDYINIDSEGVVIELLETIISFLTFSDVLGIYSEKFIEDALESPLQRIVQLALKIFRLNIEDPFLGDYLVKTGILVKLVSRLLSDVELPVAIVNEIEHILNGYIDRIDPIVQTVLLQDECKSIYFTARNSNNNTLIMRFLDLAVGMLWYIANAEPIEDLPLELYVFSKEEFINNNDILFVIYLFSFYASLVVKIDNSGNDERIINNIKNPIDNIAYLFTTRESDEIIKSFYSNEIVELFKVMSYSKSNTIQEFFKTIISKYRIFKSYNISPGSLESDLRLLSVINPDIFSEELYLDIIHDLPLYSEKYFTILLNIVQSKLVFDLLINEERITKASISSLSKDKAYMFILQLTKKVHSTMFLINDLPNVLSDYLIDSSNDINNSEVYNLKLKILENLLFNENVDLSIWKEGLTSSYEEMKNGRRINNIEPQVDILDDFL